MPGISPLIVELSRQFHNFVPILPPVACLLNAPLRNGRALDLALKARYKTLESAISRLKTLSSHDALVLLRSSFSAPHLMHTLRCAPCHGHPVLQNFYALLRDAISSTTNSRTHSGSRPAYPFAMVVWAYAEVLRLHFLLS